MSELERIKALHEKEHFQLMAMIRDNMQLGKAVYDKNEEIEELKTSQRAAIDAALEMAIDRVACVSTASSNDNYTVVRITAIEQIRAIKADDVLKSMKGEA